MRSVRAIFSVVVFGIWSSAGVSATVSQTDKEKAALAGDSAIAYELFESAMAYNNLVDALFWIRVGAEHGDCKCIREIERMLRSSSKGPEAAAKWETRGREVGCK